MDGRTANRAGIPGGERRQGGFTLAEVITSVGIIAVLLALAFVGIFQFWLSLQQMEADTTAKEIYLVAQNHLTTAEGQGLVEGSGGGSLEKGYQIDAEKGEGIYYFVYRPDLTASDASNPNNKASVLSLMLPFGSVDETVRMNGSYVIRYQPSTGLVLDVFFAKDYSFSYEEYTPLLNTRDDSGARRHYGLAGADKVIGWYGGQEPGHATVHLQSPTVQVENGDKLRVKVSNPRMNATTAGNDLQVRLVVEGKTSGAAMYWDLTGDDKVYDDSNVANPEGSTATVANTSYTVVLDDITSVDSATGLGRRFCEVVEARKAAGKVLQEGADGSPSAEFVPGEDLEVRAWAACLAESKRSNIANSNEAETNSLFGEGSGDVRVVSSMRHLSNLSANVSRFNSSNDAVSVRQATDLSWSSFKSNTQGDTTAIRCDVANAGCQAGDFLPVMPGYQLAYDGGGFVVTGVTASAAGPAGLFGELQGGSSVHDLRLVDFNVSATNAAGATDGAAGALAGQADAGVSVSSVVACNNTLASDAGLSITGEAAAGGLVGAVVGSDAAPVSVADSAAAVFVRSAGDAGGLVGVARGPVTLENSYSGGHTSGGAYDDAPVNVQSSGGDAGGLVGDASQATLDADYCYSTCSVEGAATAGGFAGSIGAGDVSYCYSTGSVSGGSSAGAFAGAVASATLRTNWYLGFFNEGLQAVGVGGAGTNMAKFDADTNTYNSFALENAASTAIPYDSTLVQRYQGHYLLRTVADLRSLAGVSDFDSAPAAQKTHYGDWPAPETLVVNVPESPATETAGAAFRFDNLPKLRTAGLSLEQPVATALATTAADATSRVGGSGGWGNLGDLGNLGNLGGLSTMGRIGASVKQAVNSGGGINVATTPDELTGQKRKSVIGSIRLKIQDALAAGDATDEVCKITDSSGNLLYYRTGSEDHPAAFTTLEGAFEALGSAYTGTHPTPLFTQGKSPSNPYTGSTKIQMLVENYTFSGTSAIDVGAYMTELTTASRAATDGYPYPSKTVAPNETATISLSADGDHVRARLFNLKGGAQLTLANVVVDGNGRAYTGAANANDGYGGLIDLGSSASGAVLTIGEGAVLQNSTAEMQGGAISNRGGTVVLDGGVIRNCKSNSSSYGGGAVHLGSSGARFQMKGGSITGCSASNFGGAVHISGGAMEMSGGEISGCNANGGSAVYVGGGTSVTMTGGSITGNKVAVEASSGGAIQFGGVNSTLSLQGNVVIFGNQDKSGRRANVFLNLRDWNNPDKIIQVIASGLGDDALIGVHPKEWQNKNANDSFASTTQAGANANLAAFENDYAIEFNSSNGAYLYGVPAAANSAGYVKWSSRSYICKIATTGRTHPFLTLKDAITYAESSLSGKATVEMLVDYSMPSSDAATIAKGDDIVLSTASKTPADGYPYVNTGTSKTKATVSRSFGDGSLLTDNGTLTLRNIVLDGVSWSYTGGKGSLVKTNESGASLTVESDAELTNAKSSDCGGAIWLKDGSSLVMNGVITSCTAAKSGGGVYAEKTGVAISVAGSISSCTATSGEGGAISASEGSSIELSGDAVISGNKAESGTGGGIYADAGSTVAMTSGTISGNSAKNGAAIIVKGNSDTTGSFTMSGGSITGNQASAGGAVAVTSSRVKLTFSGSSQVKGNISRAGWVACNVYLDRGGDNEVIEGAGLSDDAEVGVYVVDGDNGSFFEAHGGAEDPFGTYSDASGIDKFVNDRNGMRGARGEGSRMVWHEPLKVEVRYVANPDYTTIPTAPYSDQNPYGYREVYSNEDYVPSSVSMTIPELAEELRSRYGADYANTTATMEYWRSYASGEESSQFANCKIQLKTLPADRGADAGKWAVRPVNSDYWSVLGDQAIVLYYTEPVFLMLRNDSGYDINGWEFKVGGRNVADLDSFIVRSDGSLSKIGWNDISATAPKNGAYETVKILGAPGWTYSLIGGLNGVSNDAVVSVTRSDEPGEAISLDQYGSQNEPPGNIWSFTIQGTLGQGGTTTTVQFGDRLVTGEREVILRKVSSRSCASLEGAVFTVYAQNQTTVARSADGKELQNLESSANGVFFVGMMNYGVYYLKETTVPSGYGTAPLLFKMTVDDDGVRIEGPVADDDTGGGASGGGDSGGGSSDVGVPEDGANATREQAAATATAGWYPNCFVWKKSASGDYLYGQCADSTIAIVYYQGRYYVPRTQWTNPDRVRGDYFFASQGFKTGDLTNDAYNRYQTDQYNFQDIMWHEVYN